MTSLNAEDTKGVSLRAINVWIIILAVILSGLLMYATFTSLNTFSRLSKATDDFQEMEKAAHMLMDASDYLTEKVQRYTVSGNRQYRDEYFHEAFDTKRREQALEIMGRDEANASALKELQSAMDGSLALMEREYYAMCLVAEATGDTSYPLQLQEVTLAPEHAALSATEKMELARTMVLDEEYYAQKDRIRDAMAKSLQELENITQASEKKADEDMRNELLVARVVILLQTVGVFAMIWVLSYYGIQPVLRAVDNIKEDRTIDIFGSDEFINTVQDDTPIPVTGANEFRYLARTYNKMYDVFRKSVQHLNYKASHDELTRVYNRAAYDLLLSTLDQKSTYLLLVDADRFKDVNDNYGHETGDRVLQKIAETVKHNFRSDDFVCRIGGDEFVVLMVHTDRSQDKLIVSKIRQINEELADTGDGLPAVSVSVGVAHGSQAEDMVSLFDCADSALYETKKKGRNGYTFFSDAVKEDLTTP